MGQLCFVFWKNLSKQQNISAIYILQFLAILFKHLPLWAKNWNVAQQNKLVLHCYVFHIKKTVLLLLQPLIKEKLISFCLLCTRNTSVSLIKTYRQMTIQFTWEIILQLSSLKGRMRGGIILILMLQFWYLKCKKEIVKRIINFIEVFGYFLSFTIK